MSVTKLEDKDSLAILREGTLGRLGCIALGWPYVVPVNYFFDGKGFYIHTLPGKKLTVQSITAYDAGRIAAGRRGERDHRFSHQGGRNNRHGRRMVRPDSHTHRRRLRRAAPKRSSGGWRGAENRGDYLHPTIAAGHCSRPLQQD